MKKLLTITTLFLSSVSFATTIECKTISVHDGNTLTCLTHNKKRLKIRLWAIAAPELKQPFGRAAKKALAKMTLNKNIIVRTRGENKQSKIVGTVGVKEKCNQEELKKIYDDKRAEAISKNEPYSEDDVTITACYTYQSMNLTMISNGYAWYNPFFKESSEIQQAEDDWFYPVSTENHEHLKAEQKARLSKLGLWSQPNPIPPWLWKKRK